MRLGLALLVALAAGWLLVDAAWPPGWRRAPDRLVRLAVATGLGLGCTATVLFLAVAVVGGPSPGAALAGDGVLLLLLLARRRWARRLTAPPAAPPPEPTVTAGGRRLDRWLTVALLSALAGGAGAFALKAGRFPHGDWDAWAVWNLRARFLYRGGQAWRDAFSPLLGWSHPDYPLLLPGAVARLWEWAGRETRAAPIALAALFTGGTVVLVGGTVAHLRGRRLGLLSALLLAGTPVLAVHGASQYADVVVGFYLATALALLALAGEARAAGGRGGLEVLAGLAAALAAWTKNEGSLFLLAIGVSWLVVLACGEGRRGLLAFRAFALGAAPGLAVLIGFRLLLAPSSELLAPLDAATAVARLTDPARLTVAARAWLHDALAFGGGPVPATVLGLASLLLTGVRREPLRRPGPAAVALSLALSAAGLALVLVLTPYDLAWHLDTALWRLLFQLWPGCVLLLAIVAAA